MRQARQVFRTILYILGTLATVLLAGAAYMHWTGATVGLAGSGRSLVIDFADSKGHVRSD